MRQRPLQEHPADALETGGAPELCRARRSAETVRHCLSLVLALWPDGADGRGPVGERVPLALDAGVVRVERFADADDVQTRLVGQFGQKLRNLWSCFACDDFFPHIAVH